MSIVNIKDLIDAYACKFFKENERELYKKIGKSLGWKDLHKEINWSRLRVKHEQIIYNDIEGAGKPKAHVLFRSSFINDTDKEQDYLLRAERKTVSSCDIELFEGYVTEGSMDLSLEIPLPGCVLSTGAGFKREYTMEKGVTKSIQEEMTWSVESNIKIPQMSTTTAELLVKEDEYRGRFEIKTYFYGGISVKLMKDGYELLAIELDDLNDIFNSEKGFKRDKNGLFIVTRGECKAVFGIEQKIELHQKKLNVK